MSKLTHDEIVSRLCGDEFYHSGTNIDLDKVAPMILEWIEDAKSHAVEYLDEAVTRTSTDPDASPYERGFDDATMGVAAKVKRLLNGEAQ